MKEFDYTGIQILGGLEPKRKLKKSQPRLGECQNLEPLKKSYKLHEIIIDLNATGQDWNNA